MSDELQKPRQQPPFPWAGALLVVATLLSYIGLFAFIWWNRHTSLIVPVLWFLGTAITFRLGMRALQQRYEKARPR